MAYKGIPSIEGGKFDPTADPTAPGTPAPAAGEPTVTVFDTGNATLLNNDPNIDIEPPGVLKWYNNKGLNLATDGSGPNDVTLGLHQIQ